jgi:multimeric flavodoxin WrbA
MKKVLAIVSTPLKQGNTAKLVDRIFSELSKHGRMEMEKIYLSDLDLKVCRGCHACVMRGEQYCPLKDSRDLLLTKMNAADGVIFATPIYNMQVSTLMKMFIDHFAFLWHRPRLFRKKVLVACVGAGGGPVAKPVLDYMELNASRWGMETVSRISVLRFDTVMPEKMKRAQFNDIARVSRQFADALLGSSRYSPSFANLFWFNVWRNAALTGKAKKSVDYEYWNARGWLSKDVDFFYPVPINPFTRYAVRSANYLLGLFMKGVYGD